MNGTQSENSIDVGGVISKTLEIYVDQASVLLPASAVVFVISGILGAALLAASPALVLLSVIISFVATYLFTGMVVQLVADVQDGRRDSSPGQLLQAAVPVLGQLMLLAIVAGIGIAIGFVLIIVPGLILMTWWAVAAPVVVLERPGVFAALRRSRELVRGNAWQVFGVLMVLVIGVALVGFVIDGIAASASSAAGLVVRVVIGVLTAPFGALAAGVLYFQLSGARGGGGQIVEPGPSPTSDMPSGII